MRVTLQELSDSTWYNQKILVEVDNQKIPMANAFDISKPEFKKLKTRWVRSIGVDNGTLVVRLI